MVFFGYYGVYILWFCAKMYLFYSRNMDLLGVDTNYVTEVLVIYLSIEV